MTTKIDSKKAELKSMNTTTLLQNMKTIKKGEEKESPYRRKRYKVPEYLKAMTEIEKEINHQIIKNMSKRIHYLRNPRFKVDKAAITFDEVKDKVSCFTSVITDPNVEIRGKY